MDFQQDDLQGVCGGLQVGPFLFFFPSKVCRSSLDLCSGFHSNSIWNSKGTGSGIRDKPNDAGTRCDDVTWRP